MIEQVDRELKTWVQGIATGAEIILGPPRQVEGKRSVSLYLLSLADPLPAWANRQVSRQIALRYLVTAWAADEEQAHALLGALVFAALEKREYELKLDEIAASIWTGLGIAPRPAFTLLVPCALPRQAREAQLVHEPLVVQGAPVRSLHGLVLGPDSIPIAGANVELPVLQLRGQTDAGGRFFFASTPGGPQRVQIVVKARGSQQSVFVERPTSEKEPCVVRFTSFDAR